MGAHRSLHWGAQGPFLRCVRTVQSRVPEPREMVKALVRVSLEHISLMCESPTLYGVTV